MTDFDWAWVMSLAVIGLIALFSYCRKGIPAAREWCERWKKIRDELG